MGLKTDKEVKLELEENPILEKSKEGNKSRTSRKINRSNPDSESLSEEVENLKQSLFWPVVIILGLPIIPVFFGILVPEEYVMNPASYGIKAKIGHYFKMVFLELAIVVAIFRRNRRLRRRRGWFR